MRPSLRQFIEERSGAGAAEFAIVVPLFFGLVFAVIHFSAILYSEATLQAATEAAARCVSVHVSCTDQTDTSAFALSHYGGPYIHQSFTYTAPSSGTCSGMKMVTGTGTYTINAVVTSVPVTLNAHSCYP